MFRREHQECTAVNRVGSRRENANLLIYILNLEIDLRALASANPIALEQSDSFGPIELFEFIKQSLRICSDTQHPLPHGSPDNRKPADLALSIHNLLVGQNCAEFGTPVDRDIGDVSEANAVRIASAIGGNRIGPICIRVET